MAVRNFFHNVLLCLITILLVISIAEMSVRVYHSVKRNTSFLSPFVGPDRSDAFLGWTPKEFYSSVSEAVDYYGVPYRIEYRTYQYGFREWSKETRSDRRVLFLGDSFTRAAQVSNDRTYYNVARRTFPMEIFAFGGGAYGTLQEYLVLNSHYDEIAPQIIVWQFTPNVFLDNDYTLDSARGGTGMRRRPYLIDGNLKYALSLPVFNRLLFQLAEISSSRLFYMIHSGVFSIAHDQKIANLYREIEEYGPEHPGLARSRETTQTIIEMALKRVGAAKVVAFCVREQPPFDHAFRNIMKNVGIAVITEVPEALRAAEAHGVQIRARDGSHWNEKGHEIAGVALAKGLNRVLERE